MQTIMNWIFSGKVLLEDLPEGDIERLATINLIYYR